MSPTEAVAKLLPRNVTPEATLIVPRGMSLTRVGVSDRRMHKRLAAFGKNEREKARS